MIGKAAWFQRRKYLGWGVAPKTWQGWTYLVVVAALILSIQFWPMPEGWKVPAMIVIAGVLVADVLHIMFTMPKDERETQHEAFAERNASWAMIAVIIAGVAYQAAQQAAGAGTGVDMFLVAAVVAGLLAKAITNVYLERTA